jgi:hypothetical protein
MVGVRVVVVVMTGSSFTLVVFAGTIVIGTMKSQLVERSR